MSIPSTSRTTRSSALASTSKFGSNTIETDCVSPVANSIPPVREYRTDPFYNNANALIHRGDARVEYVAQQHGVRFISYPTRYATNIGLHTERPISMVLGGYQEQNALVLRTDVIASIARVRLYLELCLDISSKVHNGMITP